MNLQVPYSIAIIELEEGVKLTSQIVGILPEEVKRKTSESLINFKNMGLSVMEISHRSKQWVECMNDDTETVIALVTI